MASRIPLVRSATFRPVKLLTEPVLPPNLSVSGYWYTVRTHHASHASLASDAHSSVSDGHVTNDVLCLIWSVRGTAVLHSDVKQSLSRLFKQSLTQYSGTRS